MGKSHAIAIVALVAAGTTAWLSFAAADAAPPPPMSTNTGTEPVATPASATADARTAITPTTPAATAAPENPGPASTNAQPTAAPTAAATVVLLCRDLVQKQPVPRFRWTYAAAAATPLRGEGTDGRAELHLPPASWGELLVEAEGLASLTRPLEVPKATEPPRQIEVFLAPAALAAGVTLTAVDDRGAPVPRVRIDLWQRRVDAAPLPATADPDDEPLWKRSSSKVDGVFTLPSLAAGTYALRAQPIDDRDWPLPLQPFRAQFAFAGHEAVPLRAAFAPGVVLVLLPEDATAAPVQLDLELQVDGQAHATWWRSVDASGRLVVGRDVGIVPERAATLLALPPAHFELRARHGGTQLPIRTVPENERIRTFVVTLPR